VASKLLGILNPPQGRLTTSGQVGQYTAGVNSPKQGREASPPHSELCHPRLRRPVLWTRRVKGKEERCAGQ